MALFVFLLGTALMVRFVYLFWNYRNPYKLTMYFGKKGSGKTTVMAKLAVKYMKKGVPVYSNFYIPGAYQFDPTQLGLVDLPRNIVIMIDEVGILWNNRNFKNFSGTLREYFKLQRHYGHTIIMCSQSWDVDKTLRLLCDYLFLVECHFNIFSVAKRITRRFAVVNTESKHGTADGESKIVDDLMIQPWWLWPFGSRVVTFIPHWVKYFNSFDIEPKGVQPALIQHDFLPEMLFNRRQKIKYGFLSFFFSIHGFFIRLKSRCRRRKKFSEFSDV